MPGLECFDDPGAVIGPYTLSIWKLHIKVKTSDCGKETATVHPVSRLDDLTAVH